MVGVERHSVSADAASRERYTLGADKPQLRLREVGRVPAAPRQQRRFQRGRSARAGALREPVGPRRARGLFVKAHF